MLLIIYLDIIEEIYSFGFRNFKDEKHISTIKTNIFKYIKEKFTY
jgi:hypothetical protein